MTDARMFRTVKAFAVRMQGREVIERRRGDVAESPLRRTAAMPRRQRLRRTPRHGWRDCALAFIDGLQLMRREPSVQVHRVRADLRERATDLDDVAVVAAQHSYGVAGVDPGLRETAGDRISTCVELGKGDRAPLVDHRGAISVARCRHSERRR